MICLKNHPINFRVNEKEKKEIENNINKIKELVGKNKYNKIGIGDYFLMLHNKFGTNLISSFNDKHGFIDKEAIRDLKIMFLERKYH